VITPGSSRGRSPVLEASAFEGPKGMKGDGEDTELNPFELATLRLQTGGCFVGRFVGGVGYIEAD
jgi:hypothetical protein